jgi:hypothetical protein
MDPSRQLGPIPDEFMERVKDDLFLGDLSDIERETDPTRCDRPNRSNLTALTPTFISIRCSRPPRKRKRAQKKAMDERGNLTADRLRRIDREVESKACESLVNCCKCISLAVHHRTYVLNCQPSYPTTILSGLPRAESPHLRNSRGLIGTTTFRVRPKASTEFR